MIRFLLARTALVFTTLAALGGTAAAYSPGVARAVGPCANSQICSFSNPEDIADLAGTPWLLVSQQDVHDAAVGLAALNVSTGQIVRYPQSDFAPSCIGNARGGGIGVRAEGGGFRLERIIHSGGVAGAGADKTAADAVETYRVTLTGGQPVLTLTGCLKAPVEFFLNDIAVMKDGGFAATHMYDRAQPREPREAQFLSSQPTGYVVRWSAKDGWRKIPHSAGSFPNGIDASADGRWIAFAETYGHVISRLDLNGGHRTRVALAMNPDNVTALADGRFVVAGGTGEPLVSTRGCGQFTATGCGFPAAAMIVDFAKGTVTPIVTSGGDSAPGFSVAVIKTGKAYIGGANGNRITVVPVGAQPVMLP